MADDEVEKKQKIKELLKEFFEIKAEKERERTAVSIAKIDKQWNDLMQDVKSKELQKQVHEMKQSFLKALDYKDATITALQTQSQQMDIRNMWVACTHVKTLEELISLELGKSEALFHYYEDDLEDTKKKYSDFKKHIQEIDVEHSVWFKHLNYIEKSIFQNFVDRSKNDFSQLAAVFKDKTDKEKIVIEQDFDTRILVTWKKLQAALVKYLEDTEEMVKAFNELKAEFEKTITEAHHDTMVNKELKRTLPQLKNQVEERKKFYRQKIEKVSMSQSDCVDDMVSIKDKIAKFRKHDKAALTQLVKNSGNAIYELKRLVSKGEKITKLYKRMKRLEGQVHFEEEEKVSPQEETDDEQDSNEFLLPKELKMETTYNYMMQMDKLWQKHNMVVLKNLALEKEIKDLELHNRTLQKDVSHYMEEVGKGV